jgi:prevent-host-death family protein
MRQVSLYEAKTHLSALAEEAAAGEEIVIAKNGKPRAKLVALDAPAARPARKREFGFWNHYSWSPPDNFDDRGSGDRSALLRRSGLPRREDVNGYLLDTNALLWLGFNGCDPPRERRSSRRPCFSAPSAPLRSPSRRRSASCRCHRTVLDRTAVDLIPLDMTAIVHLRGLPLHHRDPFDRIIIVQALASGLAVATRDRAFASYAGLEILEV